MKTTARKFPEIEQLLALARLVQRRLDEQLSAIGLDTNRFLVLSEIDRLKKSGSRVIRANVAKSLGMSPTSMTGIFERLRAAELIEERRDEPMFFGLPRQKYVSISIDGEKLLRRAYDAWETINISYLGDLKDRQLKDLSSSMAAIRSALESNDGLA